MLRTMGHREAAIAYIGIDANKYLKLKCGDVLVFDGDERSTKQNHIHLPTIKVLMKAGVALYSCPLRDSRFGQRFEHVRRGKDGDRRALRRARRSHGDTGG